MRAWMGRRGRRIALGVTGLFALVALAHLPLARPLLARLVGRSGACPFGYDRARTPQQVHAALAAYAEAHRGTALARHRPALGFSLGAQTRPQIAEWARAHAFSCKDARDGSLICDGGQGASAGVDPLPVSAMWFHFGSQGALVSVTAVRNSPSADAISSAFEETRTHLETQTGGAAVVSGHPDARTLASASLRQASVELRFRDYYALLRETNLGGRYVLTEEYHALVD